MLVDLQNLATRLETTGRRLIETPSRLELRRALLADAQAMADMADADALPLFLRSLAKEAAGRAHRVARAVEATDAPDLAAVVDELADTLRELRRAVADGRA
jgi:hypothetical protein